VPLGPAKMSELASDQALLARDPAELRERSVALEDGSRTLRALEIFGESLFVSNPMTPVRARLVWRSPALRPWVSDADLAATCGHVVAAPADGFIAREALERRLSHQPIGRSDFYVCEGSLSAGSGRSVILDGLQVKGVGRTVQAPRHGDASQSDGRVLPRWMIDDVSRGALLARLLATPVLAPSASLLLAKGERVEATSFVLERDSFLVVREGSPLRLGHLQFLRGDSARLRRPLRLVLGRRMLNVLRKGEDDAAIDAAGLRAFLGELLDRALRLVAEVRLLCLYLTQVGDNADVFSRPFDFEDVLFCSPRCLFDPSLIYAPRPRESPADYFASHPFVHAKVRDPYWSSLANVHAAVSSVLLLAEAVGLRERAFKAFLSWASLRARYRGAVARSLASLVVVPKVRSAALERAARCFVSSLPLVPPFASPDAASSWSSRDLINGIVGSRTRGRGGPMTEAYRCGRLLAAGLEGAPILSRRGHYLLDHSGASIEARLAEAHAGVRDVCARSEAEERREGYARLLRIASSAFEPPA
jgi:hypothetical protein